MTDACRRTVSRDSRPKFTKFGEHMSIGQTHTVPNFIAHPTNDVLEKRYNFYTLHYFGAPGDPSGQSSPIWVVMYSKAPSIKLPNFVLF